MRALAAAATGEGGGEGGEGGGVIYDPTGYEPLDVSVSEGSDEGDEGDSDVSSDEDEVGDDGEVADTSRRRICTTTKVQKAPFFFEADRDERSKNEYSKICDELV